MWLTFTLIALSLTNLDAPDLSISPADSESDLCRQAEELVSKGKYQQARDAARRALELNPQSAQAETLIGTAEFALGNLPSAEQHLKRAVELQPRLIVAHRSLAATYLKEMRLEEARREFQQVLAFQPDDFLSHYSVGQIFLSQKQFREALEEFKNASQLKPADPALLISMIQAHLQLKQATEAASALAKLDDTLDIRDPRRRKLAALLATEGAYELAIHEFEQLLRAEPDSKELAYNLALAYYRTEKLNEASKLLEQWVERKDGAELENLLGEVEQRRGRNDLSLAAFRRATELDPGNEDYRFDYAHALVRQGALNQALEVFTAAAKTFPRSTRMLLGLGSTYYLSGKYADAAQAFLQAAEIGPQSPEVFYLLGRAYDAAGPFQQAIVTKFERYLASHPKDAWADYFYGRIIGQKSQPNGPETQVKAQEYLERAIATDGTLAEAHVELGSVLERRGNLEAARRELELAVRIEPDSVIAFYKLAQVYRKLGELERAQQTVERFEQLKAEQKENPGREKVRAFLERVRR